MTATPDFAAMPAERTRSARTLDSGIGLIRTRWPFRLALAMLAVLRATLVYGEAAKLCPPPDRPRAERSG